MNHRGLIASILAALVLLIGSAGANAATLYITEFSNGITPSGTTPAQVLPQISKTSQTVALSGSSATSAAFGSSTHFVSLICDEGCSIQFATTGTPVATTSTTLLQQGVTYNFGVAPGWVVAAIANSAGNTSAGTVSGTVAIDQTTPGSTDGVVALPVTASAASITSVVTASAAASKVICAAACNLYGFSVTSGASAGTAYLFDATSLPADGAVTPIKCYVMAASTSLGVSFGDFPVRLSTGATIGFGTGTNCFSFANSATAFISGEGK